MSFPIFCSHFFALSGQTKSGDDMTFQDKKMESYWNSLPGDVRSLISASGIRLSSLGMLTKLGEYYKNDSTLKPSPED